MRTLLLAGLILLLAACGEASSPDMRAPATAGAGSVEPPVRRCINLSNALEAPDEGDWGYRVRKSDLDRIASAGFDTVRLPVRFSAHTGDKPPYRISPELLERVSEIVLWAEAAGLKIIVDVHHFEEINAAPGEHIPRLKAIWHQLSVHFRGAPDTVLFELLNEPHGRLTVRRMDRLNRQLLDIVRQIHPERWVIVGSSQWNSPQAWLDSDPPRDRRSLQTIHYYAPFEFTHQGAPWLENPPPTGRSWGSEADRAALSRDFDRVEAKLQRLDLPMLVGEFGVYRGVPAELRARWSEAVRREAESRGMGWCHWGFASAFRAYDPDEEAWLAPIYRALMAD
mgnify:CR=1 FL=1